MKIDILTLFPKMFDGALGESMLKIAQKKKKIEVKVHNLRNWARGPHRAADDRPYGGGSGMVMMIEPIYEALRGLLGENRRAVKVILLTPKGRKFDQREAKKLAKSERLILICGHYEGLDERVRKFVTHEISIGDYILTGGEIPAMVILDAVTRLIAGVLGNGKSLTCESFEGNLLEYPQYTRPRSFRGMKVPEILLSGNHDKIARWRKMQSIDKTRKTRSDLCRK